MVFLTISVLWCPATAQTPCGHPKCPKRTGQHRRGGNRDRVIRNSGNVAPPVIESEANLTIISAPGSEVFSDEKNYGTTNEIGILFTKIKPNKQLALTVTNPIYESGKGSIFLHPAENGSLSIPLTPKPGKLNVISNVSGSDLSINGLGDYKDSVVDLRVAPGSYSISVSKTCYQKAVREVVVKPAETQTVAMSLDLQQLGVLLSLAEGHWQRQNYDSAITAVRCILNMEPEHPRANFMMGWHLYLEEEYPASIKYLVTALRGGEQIRLPIAYHSGSYHQGYLVLSKDSLEFHSSNQSGPDLRILANRIRGKAIKPKGYCLQITVGVPGDQKEMEKTFDFYPPRGTAKDSKCPICRSELEVLLSLVVQLTN